MPTMVTSGDLRTNEGVRRLGELLDVNLWSVRSFAADVRIHFDERGAILRTELLNPDHGPPAAAVLQPTPEATNDYGPR